MNLFNKLPGFQRSAPGLEQRIWRRLHGALVLTLAIGCFIVRVMKGPAYVADAYGLPQQPDGEMGVLPTKP